ncbi:MAG: ROK family protein [Solirubrobacteraceae bacterium]|nr:MAG: ROK family protein [Solirubrobacterales bacterium]
MASPTGPGTRRSPSRRTRPKGAYGGIDLGGSKIQAIVADEASKVLGKARQPTPQDGGPQAIAAAMVATMTAAAGDACVESGALRGVGVCSPGSVDSASGTVARAGNLSDWIEPFPLAAVLSEAFGTKVRVANDVQAATAAEFELGAGKPYRSLLGVFWGTGIGGGLVFDGKPWRGRGAAGEIGHMVIRRAGARCPCGRRGCLEAYAGRAAMEVAARKAEHRGEKTKLFSLMKKHDRPRLTSSIWERALHAGDPVATRLIDRAIEALGVGIASAINLVDVEAVILGGGLGVRFGEAGARRVEAAMHPHLFVDDRPPNFHVAGLGDLSGALGASLSVRESVTKRHPPARRRRPRAAD